MAGMIANEVPSADGRTVRGAEIRSIVALMPSTKDPTDPIRKKAASFPDATEGVSCNQHSFKVGKTAFLYIGPGAKGVGFKMMMKLDALAAHAAELAAKDPDRYSIGSNKWVTVRFTAEKPVPKTVWERWLKESYALATGGGAATTKKKASKKTTSAKKVTKKKVTKKKATKKKAR